MSSDPFSLDVELKVQQVRDRQLASRAVLGAMVYPLVFAMIAFPTGLIQREPKLSLAMLITLSALATVRMVTCLSFAKAYPRYPKIWRFCFVTGIASLGFSWGSISAYQLIQAPWSPTTLLFLFAGSGLAGGMVATIAIDRFAYRAYLIGLLLPPGVAALLSQQQYGSVLSGFHLLYFVFLWLQGQRQSDGFLQSARKTIQIYEQRDMLVLAKRKAEEASLAKSHLLANVSHELRTPMNTIVGTTEWALAQAELEKEKALWMEIHNAGLQLLTVINQVLDFAKIDSGVISEAKKDPFVLAETIRQVELLFRRSAESKNLQLTFHSDVGAELTLLGDEGRLRQVLCNLVGNALKFTERGTITVRFRHRSNRLHIEVQDSGPGIASDYFQKIFEPFSQADTTATRLHGGTGLGLAICKELVESMGGSIEVESRLGHGSLFRVQVEAPACHPKVDKSFEIRDFVRDYLVLVVDDDPTNLQVARRQLSHLGMRVEIAKSGPEAEQKCQEKKFDLILMDLQMPHIDGFSVTSNIKQSESSANRDTPVIAFTAHAGDEEQERCRQAGMVAFLNKPLQRSLLAAELHALESSGVLQRKSE